MAEGGVEGAWLGEFSLDLDLDFAAGGCAAGWRYLLQGRWEPTLTEPRCHHSLQEQTSDIFTIEQLPRSIRRSL